MNRTEIEAKWNTLTPRERDAWVAEVVFNEDVYVCDRQPYCLREKRSMHVCKCEGRLKAQSYTSDISAAWSILETFDYVECARLPFSPRYYGARINGTDGSIRAMTQASTAPEAICLAAVIAKLTG